MDGTLSPVLTSIKEDQRIDGATGKPVAFVRVEYMVGKHGPFIEYIVKEKFDAQSVTAMMQATAATVNALAQSLG